MASRTRRLVPTLCLLAFISLQMLSLVASAASGSNGSGSGDGTQTTTPLPTDENGKMPDGKPPDWNNKHVIYTMTGIFLALMFLYLAVVFTCAWLFMTKCPRMYT